jgi:hypothetical protein
VLAGRRVGRRSTFTSNPVPFRVPTQVCRSGRSLRFVLAWNTTPRRPRTSSWDTRTFTRRCASSHATQDRLGLRLPAHPCQVGLRKAFSFTKEGCDRASLAGTSNTMCQEAALSAIRQVVQLPTYAIRIFRCSERGVAYRHPLVRSRRQRQNAAGQSRATESQAYLEIIGTVKLSRRVDLPKLISTGIFMVISCCRRIANPRTMSQVWAQISRPFTENHRNFRRRRPRSHKRLTLYFGVVQEVSFKRGRAKRVVKNRIQKTDAGTFSLVSHA